MFAFRILCASVVQSFGQSVSLSSLAQGGHPAAVAQHVNFHLWHRLDRDLTVQNNCSAEICLVYWITRRVNLVVPAYFIISGFRGAVLVLSWQQEAHGEDGCFPEASEAFVNLDENRSCHVHFLS